MDVLTNKQFRNYNYNSRYVGFPFYYHTLDKKYIYGTTSQLKTNIDYTLHEVKNGETYDSIALDYYNNPTFYWVICDFNQVQDPYTKPKVGKNLKIPTLSNISFKEE